MAALTQARMGIETRIKTAAFPLDAAQKAWTGGIACGDTATGGVKPAQGIATLLRLGEFQQNLDNSAGTTQVNVLVSLDKEVVARWYDNSTGAAKVLAANVFSDVFMADDHTITVTAGTNSKAGRCWGVDAIKGVLVEAYTL